MPHVLYTSHSVTAKFPVPTYASVHKINTGGTLNYIFSVWLARCPNCARHIHPVNQIRISIFDLLALSILSRLRCHSLRRDLVFLPSMVGSKESKPGRSPLAPTQVHTHKQKRMISVAEHFKVENGTGPVHLEVLRPLQYCNR